jgi:hypothetical protein
LRGTLAIVEWGGSISKLAHRVNERERHAGGTSGPDEVEAGLPADWGWARRDVSVPLQLR